MYLIQFLIIINYNFDYYKLFYSFYSVVNALCMMIVQIADICMIVQIADEICIVQQMIKAKIDKHM